MFDLDLSPIEPTPEVIDVSFLKWYICCEVYSNIPHRLSLIVA